MTYAKELNQKKEKLEELLEKKIADKNFADGQVKSYLKKKQETGLTSYSTEMLERNEKESKELDLINECIQSAIEQIDNDLRKEAVLDEQAEAEKELEEEIVEGAESLEEIEEKVQSPKDV